MLEVKASPPPPEEPVPEPPVPEAPLPPAGLSVGAAARRCAVSVHTLRYYERAGLVVTTIDRTTTGRRRYHKLDLEWITVCTRLRAAGMPVKAIRRYAELVRDGHGNEQERLSLMQAHRADVVARIVELQDNLQLIDHKIDVYEGRLAAGDADTLWAPRRRPNTR